MQLATVDGSEKSYTIIIDVLVKDFEETALSSYPKLVAINYRGTPYFWEEEFFESEEFDAMGVFYEFMFAFHFESMIEYYEEFNEGTPITEEQYEMINEGIMDDMCELQESIVLDLKKYWDSLNLFYIDAKIVTPMFSGETSVQTVTTNCPLQEVW